MSVLQQASAGVQRKSYVPVPLDLFAPGRTLEFSLYGRSAGGIAPVCRAGQELTEAVLAAARKANRSVLYVDTAEHRLYQKFAEAAKSGAAILAYPVHGTLKKVSGAGVIDETVSRGGLWEAQTPQVFRKDLLLAAYEGDLSHVTDDAQLVEAAGHPVRVVMGDPRNVKITTPGDLALATAVIKTLPKPKPQGPTHPFEEARW